MAVQNLVKKCAVCKKEMGNYSFYIVSNTKDGLSWDCKVCQSKMHKLSYIKNKERIAENSRKSKLKIKYSFSTEEYLALLTKQDGKCSICFGTNPGKNNNYYYIDHDHKTGRVRGLLCRACNTLLGFAKDNRDTLLSAARYLEHGE